jgi:hypothetical protein
MAINSSVDDHIFTLYRDGSVSEGWSADLDAYDYKRGEIQEIGMDNWGNTWIWYESGFYRQIQGKAIEIQDPANWTVLDEGWYHIPPEYETGDTPAMDHAPSLFGSGRVGYAYYDDYEGSQGNGEALASLGMFSAVDYPSGHGPGSIVGMGFSGSGKAYSWYTTGGTGCLVARGAYDDLDAEATYNATLPAGQTCDDIVGIAIDWGVNDRTWVVYRDGSVSQGNSSKLAHNDYWPAP